jgi:hypothetical protein
VVANADQWNELTGNNGTDVTGLFETDGTASTALPTLSISYSSPDAYQTGNTNLGNLLNGYLDGNGGGNGPDTVPVTITNIPFAVYDVYAYVGSDTNDRSADSSVTVNGETLTYTTALVGATSFTVNSDPAADHPAVTTLLFENVTGSTLNYLQDGGAFGTSNGLTALEIVEVPEPGVTGMMLVAALAGLTVLMRRRALRA